jgi:hypothetical protein
MNPNLRNPILTKKIPIDLNLEETKHFPQGPHPVQRERRQSLYASTRTQTMLSPDEHCSVEKAKRLHGRNQIPKGMIRD